MPNWESNFVVVSGDPDKIQRFFTEAFSDGEANEPDRVLDFNLVVPQPANIEVGGCNGQHEEGVVCWYNWNIANWGSKWSATNHREPMLSGNEDTAELKLIFDTAWTQPTPIFEAIEERWEVEVNAITLDEGGAPPVFYGDNVHDHMYVSTSVEFD